MMTSLKMRCFLSITALLLLSIVPTVTKVVTSMSDCDEFFLNRTPPEIPGILKNKKILNQNRYKPICQIFNNTRRFVTLYDTENKIPVFSAGKYRGGDGSKRPKNPRWKTEPELELYDNNMRPDNTYEIKNQAAFSDYMNGGFDKGHLFPSCYGFSEDDKISTFTLTNIVPQEHTFNTGSWNKMEKCIKCAMDRYCINNNSVIEAFVVTGAQPSTNRKLNNKVNIPSMLWSAFCCYSRSENKWLASAYWGNNSADNCLRTKTLAELNEILSISTSVFEAFPGTQCPLDTNVAEFYKKKEKSKNRSKRNSETNSESSCVICGCERVSTTSAPTTPTFTTPISTSVPPSTTTTHPTTTVTTSTTTKTTTTKKTEDDSDNDKDTEQRKIKPRGETGGGGTTSGTLSTTSGHFTTTSAPSNSSTLCPPLMSASIFQHYQNVLAYYQVLYKYQKNR